MAISSSYYLDIFMKIRTATTEDIKPLTELFDSYRVFYNKKSDKLAAEIFLFERMLNHESVIYIAEDTDGKLTGFVQLYPLFSSTRMKKLWLLNDLFVKPDFRGRGISKLLINAAKKLCVATNSVGMMLETAQSNEAGNNLYQKTGFQLDKEHNYYCWDV